ncbi:MAG: sigma-70 family RNA polymerase sigma factor [Chitinophagaceae bacterium]
MTAKTTHIDSSYWARLKKGDPQALGNLYEAYADKIFNAALRMTTDRELAKDALQEVFIEIWNYRNTLGDVMHTQSYLVKVMRSIILKKLKKESQYSTHEVTDTLISPEETMEEMIVAADTDKETKSRLKAALSNLTNRQKQVLELRFNEGLSYEQIADKLCMNYQSVNNLAFRTIHRLRSQLLTIAIAFLSALFL